VNNIELTIAANSVRFDKTLPLLERLKAAMLDVRNCRREQDIFFMTGRLTDDFRFQTAIAAVMLACDDVERDQIERSLRPLRMLAAATQGIPVDFGQLEMSDDMLPLLGMWHETGEPAK
jgi:hypothetical protein